MPNLVKGTPYVQSYSAIFFISVKAVCQPLGEDREQVTSNMARSEAKLSCRDQLVFLEVLLELMLNNGFHDFAHDA